MWKKMTDPENRAGPQHFPRGGRSGAPSYLQPPQGPVGWEVLGGERLQGLSLEVGSSPGPPLPAT